MHSLKVLNVGPSSSSFEKEIILRTQEKIIMGNFTSKQTVQLSQDEDAMNMRRHMGATCHAGSVPMQHPAVADKCGVYSQSNNVLVQPRVLVCDRDVPPRPKSLRIKSADQ